MRNRRRKKNLPRSTQELHGVTRSSWYENPFFFLRVLRGTPNSSVVNILPLLLLIACTTAPKVKEKTQLESGLVPLDKGALAYALVDVPKARPILEGISYIPLDDKNMKQILDRTQRAAVAVFSHSSEDDRLFQLVSWGRYPASGSSIAFGASKDWIKRSEPTTPPYWYSEKAQMSVVVKPAQIYVMATMAKIPRSPVSSPDGIKIPEGFVEFSKGAGLSCWLSSPGPILRQKLNEMGIPLGIPAEQLFICLFPEKGQNYEARIKITFQFIGQARILTNLLFIARRNYIPPDKNADNSPAQDSAAMFSSLLFTNPAVQEGNALLLKSPPLSVHDISLLFSMFSL